MPRYVYFCEKCQEEFQTFHSIKEKYSVCNEATECSGSGELKRLPSSFSRSKKELEEKTTKPGSLVNEFIEKNKQDLKDEKKTLRKQEYKK